MAILSLRRADYPIAASKKAALFFKHIGCNNFLSTTNFFNLSSLPKPIQKELQFEKPFELIFVGRNDRIKNLSLLKEVVNNLPAENKVVLHIFGQDGIDTNRIHYHGWCTEDEIVKFMNIRAHAFILPSLFEASPLPLLSALALGLPCLVSSTALPLEYKGYAKSFSTKKELQEALLSLFENYELNAKRSFSNSYNIREVYAAKVVLTKEFEELFSQIEKKDQKTP